MLDPERDELVEANLHLVDEVRPLVAESEFEDYDELGREGRIGLLRAAQTYDQARGLSFEVHARYWIRECMRAHVANRGHTIRIPHQISRVYAKVQEFKAEFRSEHGRLPTPAEIAEHFKLN